MNRTICPPHVVKIIEGACARLLAALRSELALPRAAVAFVSEDLQFSLRSSLITDPTHELATRPVTEGLMGLSLERNESLVWPRDAVTLDRFLRVDTRTCLEIATPIRLRGLPTAILLLDFFKGEEIAVSNTFLGKVELYANRISAIIDAADALIALTERCRRETKSIRGYVAVRDEDADNELAYFWKDDAFLVLNMDEGLCGHVFASGRNTPLVVGDVWKHPLYVASDPSINSELIVPIVVQGEVIAILNLEADRREFYTPRKVRIAEEFAKVAREYVDKYRAAAFRGENDLDVMVSGLVDETMTTPGPPEFDDFRDAINGTVERVAARLANALHGQALIWRGDSEHPPAELGDLAWDTQTAGGVHLYENNERVEQYVVFAPVRTYGEIRSIIGVLMKDRPTNFAVRLVQQLCRRAGTIIVKRMQTAKESVFLRAIEDIRVRHDSVALFNSARAIKVVAGADHCTIFARIRVGTTSLLAAAASTSRDIFKVSKKEMFYAINPRDGFTGRVASTSKELLIDADMTDDSSEAERSRNNPQFRAADLKQLGEPEWKGKLSEELNYTLSAFLGLPVIDPKSNDLIGVVRLYRSKRKGQKGRFDRESIEKVRSICAALGAAYGVVGFLSISQAEALLA